MRNRKKEVKGDVDKLYDVMCHLQIREEGDRLKEVINSVTGDLEHLILKFEIGMIGGLDEVKEDIVATLSKLNACTQKEWKIGDLIPGYKRS